MADVETKPRVIRVIQGPAEVMEKQLNEMAGEWVAQVWSIAWAGDHFEICTVLVAASEIRKGMLAATMPMNSGRR